MRTTPIRWSLLRRLIALLLLLSGAIFGVLLLGASRTVEELVRGYASTLADRTQTATTRLFQTPATVLRAVAGWAANGTLRCRDLACLEPLIGPVLAEMPQVSAFLTGDATGSGVSFLRQGDGWWIREVEREDWGSRCRVTTVAADGTRSQAWEETDYDPRTRPWYTAAEASGVRWTEPYVFYTVQSPGLSASIRVTGPAGEDLVVALDVLADDIAAFTTTLPVSPHGFALVLDASGRVVGLPRSPRFADAAARRRALLGAVAELGIPAAVDLGRAGAEMGEAARTPFSFTSEGATWWGVWRPVAVDADTFLYLGVAVPLDDFLGEARRNRLVVAGLSAAALLAGVLLALGLARRFGQPLEDLAARSERIRHLDTRAEPYPRSRLREVHGLYEAQERMRQALDSFARYVPTEVVRDLLERGEAARVGGRAVELTVVFTDVRGFTPIAERLSPTELMAHMSEYFDGMVSTLKDAGATIDKLVGDAIVAFWGAPRDDPDHARRAVEAVLRCRERLEGLNATWRKQGKPELPTRFGLATGPVVVGNVGAPSRLHYTALGDTMNLGSRLEGANALYGTTVLASAATVAAAGDGFAWRRIDRVAVKGRQGAVDVYELLGRASEVDAATRVRAAAYERALERWRAGDGAGVEEALATAGDDEAVRALRARTLTAAGPGPGADGVTRLLRKREEEP